MRTASASMPAILQDKNETEFGSLRDPNSSDPNRKICSVALDDLKISDSRPRSPSTSTSGSNVQISDESSRSFKSPMPGVIISVAVSVGDQVVTGDDICVLEAMKMQQVLRADWSGIVASVNVSAGDQVVDGEVIASLE